MKRATDYTSSIASDQLTKVLLFSVSPQSSEDYAKTLSRFGVNFEIAPSFQDAKKMLKTGDFNVLISDVTNFENQGRKLIWWAKHHVTTPGFKTHGYTLTEIPGIEKKIYAIGADQRFYYNHVDVDHLTELLFTLFINHTELQWVRDMNAAQRQSERVSVISLLASHLCC